MCGGKSTGLKSEYRKAPKKGITLLDYIISFVSWESVLSLDGLYYNNNLPSEVDNKFHVATSSESDCPS